MRKTIFPVFLAFLFFSLFFPSSPLISQENKLRVIASSAYIHIDPDINSPVIETVEKGDVLTLLSPRKMEKSWYYISFFSGRRLVIISGFILDSAVEAMAAIPEAAEVPEAPEAEAKEITFEVPIQVNLEQASVRAEPNFEAQVLQQVQVGTTIPSIGKSGEWYKVKLPPDEEGNVVTGYIHQSFVGLLGKAEEVAEAEVREQVISPRPQLGAGKVWNNYLKVGANYFQFTEGSRRMTYGDGIGYEAEVSVSFWKGLQAWLGTSYLYMSEGRNRIEVFPLGVGVKYRFSKGIFNFYGGLGVNYCRYKEYSPPLNESKGELGYIAKMGSFVRVKWGFIVDFHLNYSYCYLKLATENVNIGGPEAGIGLGYIF